MFDTPLVNPFSHVKPGDTAWRQDGLRDFFFYRDPGIKDAQANRDRPPTEGTGWHLMSEGQVALVEAGDCVHRWPGITHDLFDYSPDMEHLEIVGPADFGTVEAAAMADVPRRTPWTA